MHTLFVFLRIKKYRLSEFPEVLRSIPEVDEVHLVSGKWDLIAIIRTNTDRGLETFVSQKLPEFTEIVESETLASLSSTTRRSVHSSDDRPL